jgi:hypothetical protein
VPNSVADLVRRFENNELESSAFSHADHVRVAWGLLQHHDFFAALSRMRVGLRSLAARAGRATAYNETITLAFMAVIYERVEAARDRGWRAFAEQNADLLDKNMLKRFYTATRMTSAQAREGLLLPDLPGAAL